MTQTNIDIPQIKFNRMSSAKYLELKEAGLLVDNEFYVTPDDITDGAALPLFFSTWADHKLSDISWLRADTFSWQSGAVYVAAYNELEKEFNNTKLPNYYGYTNSDGIGGGFTSENPQVGDIFYSSYSEGKQQVCGEVTAIDDTGITILINWDYSNKGQTRTALVRDTTYDATDVIIYDKEGDIYYTQTSKEYKIVLSDQEEAVLELYNNTGIAWYYILDTENKRFKLPRVANPTLYYQQVPVIGNGIALGMTDGNGDYGLFGNSTDKALRAGDVLYGTTVGTSGTNVNWSANDVSIGITTDPEKSGIIADMTQSNSPKGHLYFFVGNYEQTAIQQTAGINSETFNLKLDTDLGNASSSTKETIIMWGIPDYNKEEEKPISGFTADKDGMIVVKGLGSTDNGIEALIDGHVVMGWKTNVDDVAERGDKNAIIGKGQTLSFNISAGTIQYVKFYPFKGVSE